MTEVAEKTHAKLGPSGASRWMACPGSVPLSEGQPNKSSYHARWGTAAHELASIMLEPFSSAEVAITVEAIEDIGWLNAEAFCGRVFTVEGEEIEVDLDMATCVNDYISAVFDYLAVGDFLLVEQELGIEHITGEKGATGTGDVVIIKPGREIVSIDLKTGKGVQVDAENNPQCAMYADGAIAAWDWLHGPFEHVTSVIIQPRIEHVSEERIDRAEHDARIALIQLAAGYVEEGSLTASLCNPLTDAGWINAFLNPGPKQCRFCDAKPICPALRGEVTSGLSATAPAGRDDFPDLTLPKQAAAAAGGVAEATDDQLAAGLRAAPMIEVWLESVRAEGFRRAMDGAPPPGFKLVEGKRGNRAWVSENAATEAMKAARLKADEMYDKKLISVTKAEKVCKDKPKVWAKIAQLIAPQAAGKPSLAPESDPRPVYTPQVAAAEDFPDLAGEDVDPFS